MNWGAEINRQVANATERDLQAARSTIAELQKRIAELEAERDEALREHTDMMWQRRRAEEEAAAERKRREECEEALRKIPEFAPGPNTLRVISDYFTRYASEAENE